MRSLGILCIGEQPPVSPQVATPCFPAAPPTIYMYTDYRVKSLVGFGAWSSPVNIYTQLKKEALTLEIKYHF